jgi:outer membrane translocation and assembly module TamA
VNLTASGFFVPRAWDVTNDYGGADGEVAAYAGTKAVHVAARVGGRHLWGDAPWFEAAHIGGLNDRGYRSHRYIGNSSLYGSLSLRLWIGRLPIPLLPTRFGAVGFIDTGRVWLENEDSNTWHTSLGGGLLLQPVLAPVTVHVIAANSKEGTRFYFGLGYPF